MERKPLIFSIVILILFFVLNPVSSNAQKITKLFDAGKFEKAEQYCAKKKGEEQKICYQELADAYFNKENYEKAEEFYSKSTNPKAGYIKIADALFYKNNYEKASEFYAKTESPQIGYVKIADAYFEKSDYDQAANFYSKSDSPGKGYLKIADAYLINNNYDKAAEFYSKTDFPKDGYLKIAEAYFNISNCEKAAEYYEEVGNNEGFTKIANVYLAKENYEKAWQYYEKAKNIEGIAKIAETYFAKNDYKKAEEYYNKAYVNNIEKLKGSYEKIADQYYKEKKYLSAAKLYAKAKLKEKEKDCYDKYNLTATLVNECSTCNVDKIKNLIEKGADVNGADCGERPLRIAAVKGKLQCVKKLLELGADPTLTNNSSLASTPRVATEITLMLLKKAKETPPVILKNMDPTFQKLLDSKVSVKTYEEIIRVLEEAEKKYME